MIHVPIHTATKDRVISIPVDPRHIARVEGDTFVMRSGSRVRTAYTEADLCRLLEWSRRRAV